MSHPHVPFRDRIEFTAITDTGERMIYRILPNGELLCAACCLLLSAADWDYRATVYQRHNQAHAAARAEHEADLARADILDNHPWGCTCAHQITVERAWEALLYDPPFDTTTDPDTRRRGIRWQALTIAAGVAAGIVEVELATLCTLLPAATGTMVAVLTGGAVGLLLYRHLRSLT